MAEAQTNKDRLKEITASIETGIKELFESDKYRQYLTTMSRFHKYSVNNTMLIYMQKPDANVVAGFNKWKDQFGRNVMKGERGIKIIAPTPYKKMIEQDKLDPDTKLPMRDADGKIITEEKEIKIPMFKPVTVFDVSQTDGKPLPQLASDLQGNVQNYDVFMEALKRSAPVPIEIIPLADNLDGYFDSEHQRIAVREGMSEVQTVSATIHEIAHSKLHNRNDVGEKYQGIELFDKPALFSNGRIDRDSLPEGLYCYDLRGSDDDPGDPVTIENHVTVNHAASVITAEPIALPEEGYLRLGEDGLNFTGDEQSVKEFFQAAYPEKAKISRNTEEVQAESISFAVCAYYGIATGENSFGYIASWSKGKELSELRESLETINKTASSLITDIDRNYAEIMKERGLDKVTPEVEESAVEPTEGLFLLDDKTYLHIQPTDGGYDYTLYDKESMKLLDGGIYEDNDLPDRPARALTVARVEILALHGLTPEKVDKVSLDVLEQLQAADKVTAPEVERGVEEPPAVTAPDNGYLPDPAVSVESMNAYGYTDADMLPLSRERALELFERDVPVYMLYTDNTEAMAFDTDEIISFDGMLGVTAADWELAPDDLKLKQQDVEQVFLNNPGDTFAIYQLRNVDDTAELRFMGTDYLQSKGLEIDRANYIPVYTGNLASNGDEQDKLNDIYAKFNIDRPQDFTGHSLSVSDIVALRQNGVISCHYVDSWGFKEVPMFLPQQNYLKNAEMAMEDDYNQIDGIVNNGKRETIAELEEKVKTGQPISLLAYVEAARREAEPQEAPAPIEKKSSVLAKLHTPSTENTMKSAPKKSAERELL